MVLNMQTQSNASHVKTLGHSKCHSDAYDYVYVHCKNWEKPQILKMGILRIPDYERLGLD